MIDELQLFAGREGDPETGEGYMPQLSLQQAGRHELHVIVSEEAEGMAEGVSPEMFDAMAREVELALRLLRFVRSQSEQVGLSVRHTDNGYAVMAVFGQEAEDSPMAGGAIHGLEATFEQSLDHALSEAGG